MRTSALALGALLAAACNDAGGGDGSSSDPQTGDGNGGSSHTTQSSDAADGATGDGSSGSSGSPEDPGVEFCPWIADHDYTHASDAFFEPSVVIRIDVEMDAEDWQWQLDNPDLEEYRPARVTFCGQRADNAGMRFKKSAHANADLEEGYAKNPIVLDLNEYMPGDKLRGLRKINLEYGDDRMLVAERLNWEMLATFDRNVSRTNHARLYLNGEYLGLFTNVERVDRSYAKLHFGDNDGQLYKHSYCGTFEYKGDDFGNYNDGYQGGCYVAKPDDSVTDHAQLLRFIDVLNNTPDGDFEAVFPTIFDVDEWIPTTAALQVIGYGDTPNANGNNFYTYYPPAGEVTRFALWDLDGGYWWDGAPCEHPADVIGWDLFRISSCFSELPLFHRTVEVPAFRKRYLEAARDFLLGPFDPDTFAGEVDRVVDLIAPELADDPNRRGDDAQWAADVDELVALQAMRAANVRQQLEDLGIL